MRRKSERVKDKDKSTERKADKSPKKSRRSSRRRKKSSSTSPEDESETDEYDASFKTCKDDSDEEHSSSRSMPGKSMAMPTETDTGAASVPTEVEGKESPHMSGGRMRRHAKKHSEEIEEKQASAEIVSDNQEKVEGADAVSESIEKLKENESKSSVWQVKSADCSGGEITKLKLRIVRPQEPAEPEPRKRKKLSRMSHREADGESEELAAHDSPDEKRKSRKSASTVKEDSKSESRKRHGSGNRKARTEDSSDDEERGIGSTDVAPAQIEISDDKEVQEAEESSQVIDKKIMQDSSDSVEEASVTGDLEISIDNNNSVESSRSPKQAKEAVFLDPFDQLRLEKPAPLEQSSAENLKPSSSSERSPESIHNSPKEMNIEVTTENKIDSKPIASDLPEKSQNDSSLSEKISEAPDSSEDKVDVGLPNSSATSEEAKSKPKSLESLSEMQAIDAEGKIKTRVSSIENTDAAEHKTTTQKLPEKTIISLKIPVKKSTSHDSSDSEEERLNYRKLHESKKSVHRLTRHTPDTRSTVLDTPEKTCKISIPQSKPSIFKVDTLVHKTDDLQNKSKSTNTHNICSSKDIKHKDVQRSTPRLERKRHKSIEKHGNADSTEKPIVREKVSLKRSSSVRPNDGSVSSEILLKGEGFNVPDSNTVTENMPMESELQPNLTRKRRWGASKSTTAIKKPTLSISSDSLKHLVPEVKPLPISEVQLTEDEDEEEEGEVLDKVEDSFEIEEEICVETQRDEEIQSNNHTAVKELSFSLPTVPDPPEAKSSSVRKISIISADAARLQRSPSPARHRTSNVLFVTNLVRPFTINQLKELLARTGTIVENGFWIDKIKSKCYVQYETDTEAQETRHALHGVRWPVSNPKQLSVDYARKEDMDLTRDLAEGNHIRKTEPLKMERTDGWLADKDREVVREDRDRDRARGKERHVPSPVNVLEKSREAKMAVSIREWDLGKMDMGSFDDRGFHREERGAGDRERRIRKERGHRSPSREPPGRKIRKKDEEAPAKLLDDLFKKTKVTPCVYWLPLTADQIVVKEEMRRKHMAEHERRMEEMRKAEKAERDRQRGRMQGRSSQRRFDDRDRDKRRHRSPSGSSKK